VLQASFIAISLSGVSLPNVTQGPGLFPIRELQVSRDAPSGGDGKSRYEEYGHLEQLYDGGRHT